MQAKRYFAFKDKLYCNTLSAVSKTTLLFQGYIMNEQEAEQFEKNKLFDLVIERRIWDGQVKETNYKMLDLDYIRKIMPVHLKNNQPIVIN